MSRNIGLITDRFQISSCQEKLGGKPVMKYILRDCMKITLFSLAQTDRPWLRLPAYGLFVRPARTADGASLARPPVAYVLSATLRALFSGLPGLPAMQPPLKPINLPTSVAR